MEHVQHLFTLAFPFVSQFIQYSTLFLYHVTEIDFFFLLWVIVK